MKRYFYFTTLILFFLPLITSAQQNDRPNHYWGLRAGLNASTLTNPPTTIEYRFKPGLYVGGYYQRNLKRGMAVAFELGYSQMGAYNIFSSPYSYDKTVFKFNYLTAPITFKKYFTKSFYIQLGGYLSLPLSTKQKYWPWVGFPNHSVKENIGLTSLDAGIIGGCGYDLPNGLNFSFRYFNGLVNIEPQYLGGAKSLRNIYFQFAVGYSFGKKK